MFVFQYLNKTTLFFVSIVLGVVELPLDVTTITCITVRCLEHGLLWTIR